MIRRMMNDLSYFFFNLCHEWIYARFHLACINKSRARCPDPSGFVLCSQVIVIFTYCPKMEPVFLPPPYLCTSGSQTWNKPSVLERTSSAHTINDKSRNLLSYREYLEFLKLYLILFLFDVNKYYAKCLVGHRQQMYIRYACYCLIHYSVFAPVIDLNFAAHVWCTASVAQICFSWNIVFVEKNVPPICWDQDVYFLSVFSFNEQHFMDTVTLVNM